MYCKVESKEIQEIKPANILQQTSFWAKVKNEQGLKPYAFSITVSDDLLYPLKTGSKRINDDILILIRYLNSKDCFAYIPYGPKIVPEGENYGVFLEELSESIKPYLPKNCILIRYDLPWQNLWSKEKNYYDENGYLIEKPAVQNQEFRLNFKTNNQNLHKSPTDILPTSTFFLNLQQDEDYLLKKMKAKTRYNIKLSFRKGVTVREYGLDKLNDWYEIYKETSARNNLTLHSKKYFNSVLKIQKQSFKDVKVSLLMGDYEGEYLAAMFLILSKNRGTYLYGASSSEKRNFMATYAVQWEAIKLAKQSGCTEYDMFGISPNSKQSHPLYGLFRFKNGFGGNIYHRMGCWDYPLMEDEYMAFRAYEVNNQSYHTS